jgi:hypothetical protein
MWKFELITGEFFTLRCVDWWPALVMKNSSQVVSAVKIGS